MSYLDAPRLHFSGWFQADVSTINNDVRFYQSESFVPEYQQLNQNGSWNPEGTGIFRFVDCVVTGAHIGARGIVTPGDDPVIGMLIENADGRAPGKLVDLDPQQQMVSEIWGMQVRLLDAARQPCFSGEFAPAAFCNLWKRQQTGVPRDQQLAANYQSVLEGVDWTRMADSALLHALREASDDGLLSIAFNVYGYGRDSTIERYTMGHVAGTIGPYRRGEPKHFVSGRQMIADTAASPVAPAGGVFSAQGAFEADCASLSLDLGNSFQIKSADSGLLDIGQVLVGVLRSNPQAALKTVEATQVALIGEVPYRDPAWYAQTAGVQSFDLRGNSDALALLPDHPLVLLSPAAAQAQYTVLLQESIDGLYLRADRFVFRLDPGQTDAVELYATRFGKRLADAQIDLNATQGMMGGSGGGDTVTPPTRPHAAIPNIATPADVFSFAASARTDSDGFAKVALRLSEHGPGNPRGYIPGQMYGMAYRLSLQPSGYLSNPLNYVSVLAFDRKDMPVAPNWYDDIRPVFAPYGNLYPIMGRYVVDLNSYESVCARIGALHLAFSLPMRDPNHMPVTRDLGRDDRAIILKWLSSLGADGRPLLGHPPVSAPAAASLTSVAPDASPPPPPPDPTLQSIQGAGKTSFLMQYERRRRGGTPEPGDTP